MWIKNHAGKKETCRERDVNRKSAFFVVFILEK